MLARQVLYHSIVILHVTALCCAGRRDQRHFKAMLIDDSNGVKKEPVVLMHRPHTTVRTGWKSQPPGELPESF
jgi:hypothetical protein